MLQYTKKQCKIKTILGKGYEMKNEKYEFYENKMWYVFWALFCILWIVIAPFIWKSDDVDGYFKFTICWVICWCLCFLVLVAREIFSQKEAFIVVDEIRIKFKDKSALTFRMLNTGESQVFLWNEIKSVSLARPFLAMRKGWKYEKEIRLDLRNGQKKWIWTRFLSRKDKDMLLKTIQKYKKIQVDERIWP